MSNTTTLSPRQEELTLESGGSFVALPDLDVTLAKQIQSTPEIHRPYNSTKNKTPQPPDIKPQKGESYRSKHNEFINILRARKMTEKSR